MDDLASEWQRTGATLSAKTAPKGLGLTPVAKVHGALTAAANLPESAPATAAVS